MSEDLEGRTERETISQQDSKTYIYYCKHCGYDEERSSPLEGKNPTCSECGYKYNPPIIK